MRLSTMTHARLRAEQGDMPGARRILRSILAVDARHCAARELLDRLDPRDSPESGAATGRRIERLESWLNRIRSGSSGKDS